MFVVSRYEYLLRLYLAEVLKRVPLWSAWTYYKGAVVALTDRGVTK